MKNEQSNVLRQRRQKAEALREAGVKLYVNDVKIPHVIADLLPRGDALAPESHEQNGGSYQVAGRIMSMRRFGKPVEVADLVLFLSSSASDLICGAVILIDGGYTAV